MRCAVSGRTQQRSHGVQSIWEYILPVCHWEATCLQRHSYRLPDCSIIFFHLAITCWVVGCSSTGGNSFTLKELTKLLTHERRPPIRVDVCWHSKNRKELAEASYNTLCADIFAWEHEREPAVFINDVEEVGVLIV